MSRPKNRHDERATLDIFCRRDHHLGTVKKQDELCVIEAKDGQLTWPTDDDGKTTVFGRCGTCESKGVWKPLEDSWDDKILPRLAEVETNLSSQRAKWRLGTGRKPE